MRRAENRSGGLGADVAGPEVDGGADARARSPCAEHRPPVEGVVARVAARVVRIHAVAGQAVVVARHAAGNPVGQLGELRLGDDDCAGVFQVLRQRRLVRRDETRKRQRTPGRRHIRRVNVVLEGDRDSVQRAADLALRAFTIPLVRLLQRMGVHRDDRIQPVLVHRDSRKVLVDDLARRGAPLLHRSPHLGDSGFNHRERLGRVRF